jgi:hypothetical protein
MMKYFWPTVGFWAAVLATTYTWYALDRDMRVTAHELSPTTVERSLKGDAGEMTFAKHLALNPDMFDGPKDNAELAQEPNLKGGVMVADPTVVHTLLFLKAGSQPQEPRAGRPND